MPVTPFALVEAWIMEPMVHRRVSVIIACGTQQKRFFLYPPRDQGSIYVNWDAKRPSSRLNPINILQNIENNRPLK